MDSYDEQILDSMREMERKKYKTLNTGIYVDDELITFSKYTLPDTSIHVILPDSFVILPENIKTIKYPYKNSPDFIYTSLSGTVNLGFNLLHEVLQEGDTQIMSNQAQIGLKNINPSIRIQNQDNGKTDQGNEMSWFEFKGHSLDGQNFNKMYLIRMRNMVLHGVFSCILEDKMKWEEIIKQIFLTIEEDLGD